MRPEEGEEEGEGEDEDELGELERKMEALNLPEHAKKAAKKELKVQCAVHVYRLYYLHDQKFTSIYRSKKVPVPFLYNVDSVVLRMCESYNAN